MKKNEIFARRLRALRREKGITQTELAGKMGASRSSVASWETGTRFPKASDIEYLSRLFGVPADYLYGTSDHRYKIDTRDYFELDLTKLNGDGVGMLKDLYELLLISEKYRK